ncbi:hypothetical protein AB0M50_19155 [Nonomuraea fuscirosea]
MSLCHYIVARDGMRVAFTYVTRRDRAEQVVGEVVALQGHAASP